MVKPVNQSATRISLTGLTGLIGFSTDRFAFGTSFHTKQFLKQYTSRTLVLISHLLHNEFKKCNMEVEQRTMLSKRQYNIPQFVHDYTSEYGFAPSMREIGMATRITSTSIVNYNVERLIARGYLVKSPGKFLAITLTEKAIALIESNPADKHINAQYKVEPLEVAETTLLVGEINKLRADNLLLKHFRILISFTDSSFSYSATMSVKN